MVMLITEEVKCKEARERKPAEVRLRKTSTFEPDFEGKMALGCALQLSPEELVYADAGCVNYGETSTLRNRGRR